jgi:hypothetical protein
MFLLILWLRYRFAVCLASAFCANPRVKLKLDENVPLSKKQSPLTSDRNALPIGRDSGGPTRIYRHN